MKAKSMNAGYEQITYTWNDGTMKCDGILELQALLLIKVILGYYSEEDSW